MIFDPQTFFQTYQKDYHKIKAIYLKGMLSNLPEYIKTLYGDNIDKEYKESIQRALKSDLRQTYFHAIETFFELFFALNPKGKKTFDDRYVLYSLTNSNWQATYKNIKEISENDSALDFLDEEIEFLGHKTTIGHYLFYIGIFSKEKFPQKVFDEIKESIEAIKIGIRIIASDFVNRDEYNAYKHGLRLIPSMSKLMIADANNMEVQLEWDISDSMSFYLKTKYPDELKVVTKLFDTERDYQMTYFCSNMIHHMIFFRRLMMRFESDKEKFDKIPITFFGKEPIEKCTRVNVGIQDLVYSVTRT
jgi:hypothetical protein